MTRYLVCVIVCAIITAIYTFIVWNSANGELEEFLIERILPKSTTNPSTIKYMEGFGLAEILMKIIVLVIAVGIVVVIKMNWGDIEDKDAKIETSRVKAAQRFVLK